MCQKHNIEKRALVKIKKAFWPHELRIKIIIIPFEQKEKFSEA